MKTLAEDATVLVRAEGPAAYITLNRPDKRNALSLELLEELLGTLRRVSSEPDVRVIVLEGAGPAFSAGHDLGEMVGRELAFYQQLFDVCTEVMETIHRLPQPVIARVHGIATAAGCQLVAACDLRSQRRAPASARRASRSASSARRRWCRSRGRSAASGRSRCC